MNKTLKWMGRALTALLIFSALGWWWVGPKWRSLILDPPEALDVLFWSQSQRDAAFQVMDQFSLLVKSREMLPSSKVKELPIGEELILNEDIDGFFEEQRLAGGLILHKGKIRFEKYSLGHSADSRWTSFSMAKSFTSSLVGIALKEGHISSLNDNVSEYVTGLKDSVYDNVTIEQLLTMTSGVAWNEDYTDPNSDVAMFNNHKAEDGLPTIVSYMRGLSRAYPPGEKWQYSTGETNLIGILVERATGRNISEYLTEKIWQPFGMAQKATWILGSDGNEISGCCIQASLRDFARYGLFMLENGQIEGESVFPDDWVAKATIKQVDYGFPDRGYGYQWWTFNDGSYTARGIFGQTIFIDPNRNLVIAFNGNWPTASDADLNRKRFEFIDRIKVAIDLQANE
ncbi:serine hydrolase domain-containing protein [Aliiglaciecola lipolytica]|uniref:serine hydrolase domain-containing protein n=1 Tax=Aliiglaciecola lipolytica TaxID=477689 RepID=UPI001C095966|nr:serine hydrolase [Aliiglaciecola lipolytica]MBU2878173.1 beta-lactamase family protein [Aliiglaciecola lipolytica]